MPLPLLSCKIPSSFVARIRLIEVFKIYGFIGPSKMVKKKKRSHILMWHFEEEKGGK